MLFILCLPTAPLLDTVSQFAISGNKYYGLDRFLLCLTALCVDVSPLPVCSLELVWTGPPATGYSHITLVIPRKKDVLSKIASQTNGDLYITRSDDG